MNSISVKLEGDKVNYLPGESISGTCAWELAKDPKNVEVALLWHTHGKGTREVVLVDSVIFNAPGRSGTKDFSYALPWGPYSFQSSYIKLNWTIEVIAYPLKRCARIDMVVSPTRDTLMLTKLRG